MEDPQTGEEEDFAKLNVFLSSFSDLLFRCAFLFHCFSDVLLSDVLVPSSYIVFCMARCLFVKPSVFVTFACFALGKISIYNSKLKKNVLSFFIT